MPIRRYLDVDIFHRRADFCVGSSSAFTLRRTVHTHISISKKAYHLSRMFIENWKLIKE